MSEYQSEYERMLSELDELGQKIKEVYKLILLKQHNCILPHELQRLDKLIKEIFENVEPYLYNWLVWHGVLGLDEMLENDDVREWARELLGWHDDDEVLASTTLYYITWGEVHNALIGILYDKMEEAGLVDDEVSQTIYSIYRDIVEVLKNYDSVDLSTKIIILDDLVDLEHRFGSYLRDYLSVDVPSVKRRAEAEFLEIAKKRGCLKS